MVGTAEKNYSSTSNADTEAILRALKSGETIDEIHLEDKNLVDADLADLAFEIPSAAGLTRLNFGSNPAITDVGIAAVAKAVAQSGSIVGIKLEKCDGVSEAGAMMIFDVVRASADKQLTAVVSGANVPHLVARRIEMAGRVNQLDTPLRSAMGVLLDTISSTPVPDAPENETGEVQEKLVDGNHSDKESADSVPAASTMIEDGGYAIEITAVKNPPIQLLRDVCTASVSPVRSIVFVRCSLGDVCAGSIADMIAESKVLRRIGIVSDSFSSAGVWILAAGLRRNGSVAELQLENNRITDEGCRTLEALCLENSSLKRIHLDDNAVSEVVRAGLDHKLLLNRQPRQLKMAFLAVRSNDPTVTTIDFSDSEGMEMAPYFLGPLLKKAMYLERLDLCSTNIGDAGAKHIGKALVHNTTLKHVCLRRNGITDEGANAVVAGLQNNATLEELHFANNELTDGAGKDIMMLLQTNRTLKYVNVATNDVSEEMIDEIEGLLLVNQQPLALKEVLRAAQANVPKLTAIDFSEYDGHQYHTCDSAKLLAKALDGNSHVVSINYANNSVADPGAIALAGLVEGNRNLESLDFCSCAVTDRGAIALIDALTSNRKMTALSLKGCAIGERTGAAMLALLQHNHTLADVNVDGTNVSEATRHEIALACAVNTQPPALKEILPRLRACDKTLTEVMLDGKGGFDGRPFDDDALAILMAEMEASPHISELTIRGASFGVVGAQAVAKYVHLSQTSLQTIDFSNNDKFDDAASIELAVAIAGCEKLRELDLSGCMVGTEGVLAFVESLKKNDSVQEIHLQNQGVAISGAAMSNLTKELCINYAALRLKPLLPAIESNNPTLQELIIPGDGTPEDGQTLGDKAIHLLAIALGKNSTVTSIDLSSNDISSRGVAFLADALEDNTSVRSLDLANNRIDAAGALELIRILHVNDTLKILNLDNNPIAGVVREQFDYVVQLCNGPPALKRYVLAATAADAESDDGERDPQFDGSDVLEFAGRSGSLLFTDENVATLCPLLVHDKTVRAIYLQDNDITDAGAAMLADLLRLNATVTCLRLDGNRITDDGAEAFVHTLRKNHTLVELSLQENRISEEQMDVLDNQLQINGKAIKAAADEPREVEECDEVDDEIMFKDTDYMRAVEQQVAADTSSRMPIPPKQKRKPGPRNPTVIAAKQSMEGAAASGQSHKPMAIAAPPLSQRSVTPPRHR